MYELIATATFGLEAVVRREIEGLGYEILKTEDGKVTFAGDERAIVRSNLWLRCADRVLLKVCEFEALTFEDLFQLTLGCGIGDLLPADAAFPVRGKCARSALMSVRDCQAIVNSITLYQGTVTEAIESGRTAICSFCARRHADELDLDALNVEKEIGEEEAVAPAA